MGLCPCLCLSVCPSQVGVLLKRLNIESQKQKHTIVQNFRDSSFFEAKHLREIRPGSPPTRMPNVTALTCELQLNFFIWLKVCCVLSNVGSSEKSLWVVVGGSEKNQLPVMCGNWNVRQAVSQQVFRVTTFCINTCFQSFSSMISSIVHHAVLKFRPCRNKPLPQASTCLYQYTRSSCSLPLTQY